MEKTFNYSFGKAYCYKNYIFFEANAEIEISCEDAQRLLNDIYKHYKGRKFIYISHRKVRYVVNLESYRYVDNNQMLGIAIVSKTMDPEKDLLKEQALFEGPFAFFKNLEEAISWVETFEFDY